MLKRRLLQIASSSAVDTLWVLPGVTTAILQKWLGSPIPRGYSLADLKPGRCQLEPKARCIVVRKYLIRPAGWFVFVLGCYGLDT
jgi:hypothetical protein